MKYIKYLICCFILLFSNYIYASTGYVFSYSTISSSCPKDYETSTAALCSTLKNIKDQNYVFSSNSPSYPSVGVCHDPDGSGYKSVYVCTVNSPKPKCDASQYFSVTSPDTLGLGFSSNSYCRNGCQRSLVATSTYSGSTGSVSITNWCWTDGTCEGYSKNTGEQCSTDTPGISDSPYGSVPPARTECKGGYGMFNGEVVCVNNKPKDTASSSDSASTPASGDSGSGSSGSFGTGSGSSSSGEQNGTANSTSTSTSTTTSTSGDGQTTVTNNITNNTTVNVDLSAVNQAVNGIGRDITSAVNLLHGTVNGISGKVDGTNQKLDNVNSKLDTANQHLSNLNAKLDFSSVVGAVNGVGAKVDGVRSDLATIFSTEGIEKFDTLGTASNSTEYNSAVGNAQNALNNFANKLTFSNTACVADFQIDLPIFGKVNIPLSEYCELLALVKIFLQLATLMLCLRMINDTVRHF